MLRRRIMKRLSKSASDLSGCRKKTCSTSPDEEHREFGLELDQERPGSAGSTHSVPGGFRSGRSSSRPQPPPSEVGIRTAGDQIHSVYKSQQQGFLSMLKQRFSSRSSSRESDSRTKSSLEDTPRTHNNNCEGARRTSSPEIVRIRCQASQDSSDPATDTQPEVVRHVLIRGQESEPLPNSDKAPNRPHEPPPSPPPPPAPSEPPCPTSPDRVELLHSFPYFHVIVHLKQGHDLPAKDSNGTSDPYIKFIWKGKQVYKSKTIYKDLNPFWDESFILAVDDPFTNIDIKVSELQLTTIHFVADPILPKVNYCYNVSGHMTSPTILNTTCKFWPTKVVVYSYTNCVK